ncbi:gamma-glutamylcyclotransferase-like [Drosophila sulfurigaster albostrigata]|uniref:gamma-glutamylcyclotransferase-like n=1 Tax=Drosophila sulfurigaster albostrigata TaxID=89887 RepID=UPI002D219015|nr:gamma-glutamylcyclotransferase-like [Drosophila sulfurigaster albostrigata]
MRALSALNVLVMALCGVSQIRGLSLLQQLPEVHGDKFFYFGFGSNMLAKRIHIKNPSAKFLGAALLKNYRVDFSLPSKFWKGAVATAVPTLGMQTWGTLWEIDLANLSDLDNQEGVHLGRYKPVSVKVKLRSNDKEIPARLYVITKKPKGNVHDLPSHEVPLNRQPSKTYLRVMVKGAMESGIPEKYITWLKGFKHNNQTVQELEDLFELDSVEL